MPKRGLIVGKFYPPHRGHKYLIESGQAHVDELYIIVCKKPHEEPNGELRAQWLAEIHPQAKVLLIDDRYDENDSRVWAENSVRWLGFKPDVVFTSEDYGDRFAHFLGCEHVIIDKARLTVPVSGTKVRTDPFAMWEYLEPPVRGYYAKRVCLVGAESTGKTTLAQALAERYKTVWVPEYGREYSEIKLMKGESDWTSDEFTHIARRQCELENELARQANRILICDTDAFATSIWHRRYIGERSLEVERIATEHRRPDLYLLTDVSIPFVQDGTRDGELIRDWMHRTFIEELDASNRPYVLVSGNREECLAQAIRHIDNLVLLPHAN
ncbi:MAG TPA: AAA family ATPase, partial [Blastocatellia bacterium]|nr:AAA family ATPase [Blastocatellia bacterium]